MQVQARRPSRAYAHGVTWRSTAQALLDAATGASLTAPLARSLLAGGSIFARDCRQIVVYLESIGTAPIPTGELPGGQSCAVVPSLNLVVAFHADCYPAADDRGKPPPPADVTAWVVEFVEDVEAIWNAVADAAFAGSLGECSGVTIGLSEISGPQGGGAELTIPVAILPL